MIILGKYLQNGSNTDNSIICDELGSQLEVKQNLHTILYLKLKNLLGLMNYE